MNLSHPIFSKYKLHHIIFWAVYHFMWWLWFTGDIMVVADALFFSPHFFKYAFYVVFQALGVYFNLYFLLPKFLATRRYFLYISYTLLTIVIVAFIITPGYLLSSYFSGIPLQELYGEDKDSLWSFFRYNSLGSTAAAMTLAMSIKLAKNYLQVQKKQHQLEQEKLQTELKFLKSQFNPHFLFNTINSVFVLIKENPNLAQGTLAKFSDLLRYQLYECNEKQISFAKEVSYIKNFIELERLRQNDNVRIIEDVAVENEEEFEIAPFILMPFIENAFKHVSTHKNDENRIEIVIKNQGSQLEVFVENTKNAELNSSPLVDYSGIGLKNVKRRLELLYPDRHKISIHNGTSKFSCSLILELDKISVTEFAVA